MRIEEIVHSLPGSRGSSLHLPWWGDSRKPASTQIIRGQIANNNMKGNSHFKQ